MSRPSALIMALAIGIVAILAVVRATQGGAGFGGTELVATAVGIVVIGLGLQRSQDRLARSIGMALVAAGAVGAVAVAVATLVTRSG